MTTRTRTITRTTIRRSENFRWRWLLAVPALFLLFPDSPVKAESLDPAFRHWIPLSQLASGHDLTWKALPREQDDDPVRESLTSPQGEALFSPLTPYFLLNGIKVDLPSRPVVDPADQTLRVDPQWGRGYILPFLTGQPHLRPVGVTLFLDPGHGGRQPGALNQELGLVEKDLALEVALDLKTLMEARGWRVLLSREEDRELSLPERAQLANRAGADLFVSIHFNAALNPEARGFETFILPPHSLVHDPARRPPDLPTTGFPGNRSDVANAHLAWAIQHSLVSQLGWPDRGVRRNNFAVLRPLEMPGVLVELGFLSHPEEAALVAQPTIRSQLSAALEQGLLAYQIKALRTPRE